MERTNNMYINPFVAGILATLMVEIVALIVIAFVKVGKGGDKE